MRSVLLLLLSIFSVVLCAQQQRVTLLFVGDLMQHKGQIAAAKDEHGNYDYSTCFQRVSPIIKKADIAIANLEVTLGGKPYTGYPQFSAPDSYLKAIKEAGFDVLLTANNHCLDRGKAGAERTLMMLDSLKIPHLGTYRSSEERENNYPLLIEKNGIKIALLNYTYGTNGFTVKPPFIVNYIDKPKMIKDIQKAQRMKPDVIIACMHWGEEYQLKQNKSQQELAQWLIQHGVHHVIGAHPHVIQPVELIYEEQRKHLIAYSLGNFISNMSAPNTFGGMMLTMELAKQNISNQPVFDSRRNMIFEHSMDDYKVCNVRNCFYELVWVGKPQEVGEKNYMVFPADERPDKITQKKDNSLNIFFKTNRDNLRKNNLYIYEKTK